MRTTDWEKVKGKVTAVNLSNRMAAVKSEVETEAAAVAVAVAVVGAVTLIVASVAVLSAGQ